MSAEKLMKIQERKMIEPKLGKLTFTNVVKEIHEGTFGRQIVIDYPDWCSAIILCTNTGYGLKPLRILLPHQIYEADLIEILDENPGIKSFTAIPIDPKEYLEFLK